MANQSDLCCCGHRYADHGVHTSACIVVNCDCRSFCEPDEWDEYEEAGATDLEEQLDRALDRAFPETNKS